METRRKYTVVDLFCGCGGFTLGMKKAGFRTLAAIDFDAAAVETLRKNLPKIENVLERDLTKFSPSQLDEIIKGEPVDIIVGGPPCQGFSKARRVDGSNHGDEIVKDSRRNLYKYFLNYVAYFQPRVFVMENVLGIKTAANGEFFELVQKKARKLGYRVHGEIIEVWRYGVPQKRVRQLIIGTRRELPLFVSKKYLKTTHTDPSVDGGKEPWVSLWEAIGDLPPLRASEGEHESIYDKDRLRSQIKKYGDRYIGRVLEIKQAKKLNGHFAREHSARDLRDFARVREGESSAVVLARGEKMEFPYSKKNFRDRYTRQHRNRLCSTIVAHLSKDGLMFIHPTQQRSLTPREAARIQSFPDWFLLPKSQAASFRLIGNAVPPLVASVVGDGIIDYLADAYKADIRASGSAVPRNAKEALDWILPLLEAMDERRLRKVNRPNFAKGWAGLAFIHHLLHPDNSRSTRGRILRGGMRIPLISQADPRLLRPIYASTGWPVNLVPIAAEARRRLRARKFKDSEYYCSSAHVAGAKWFANNPSKISYGTHS